MHQFVKFKGKGWDIFEIKLVNFFLCLFTLNIYYPWAKVKLLTYLYSKTEFFGFDLAFHGTGKELFIGYIKAFALIIAVYSFWIFATISDDPELMVLAGISIFIVMSIIVPLSIHGSMRYRMAKTEWRGIRGGYRGNRGELVKKYIFGLLITVLTLGIYGPWFITDLRSYVINNLRLGSLELKFNGKGTSYFWICFKGVLLTVLTLGLYSFWFTRDVYRFHVNHVKICLDGVEQKLVSEAKVMGFIELIVVNWFIVSFTFGLGYPWALERSLRFYMEHMVMEDAINTNAVSQTEDEYNDALGEDFGDMMDMALF